MRSRKVAHGDAPAYALDGAATARTVVDGDGSIVEWNEGAERLLGWSPAEVVGRPAKELLAAGSPFPMPAPGSVSWSGTLTLRHRDGRTVSAWLLAHQRRQKDADDTGWLVLCPLDDPGPLVRDDPLAMAVLMQSPCATAVFDEQLRLRGINGMMADAVGMPEENLRGLHMSEIVGGRQGERLEEQLREVLADGRRKDVQTFLRAADEHSAHAWSAGIAPLIDAEGVPIGVCVTGHDITEQYRARQRLQLVNEASIRIGTTLDVTRTAQELADVCVPVLADFVSVDLMQSLDHGDEPHEGPLSPPFTLRRAAHRSINPGSPEAVVELGGTHVYPAISPQAASLVAGHTVTTADAAVSLKEWLALDPARGSRVEEYGIHATMSVPIRARGTTLGVAVLSRYKRLDPFTPDDQLLAEEVTARAAVCIDNARRYSRERETALALQRSLLPQTLPHMPALEAASRYLPAAQSGVGGDWFDVIPLSGMRVAMVVGDVVGHGVQASATMGRLRTAVRTLADVDLAPDELLTHLDDLVVRLSAEAGSEGVTGEVGATCLYAVYDPVSRRCTFARAGHPPPVVLDPDGRPMEVEVPAGQPLGLGGLPFESAELELAEGTVLALYTDGLIETRDRDIDAGQELLARALSGRTGSLDEVCQEVIGSLLPPNGAPDDVALLLARTRGLPPAQVATWAIPADPAFVSRTRQYVLTQMALWGISETAFTAELVVSELVTNAIRHGAPPIQLRLIHDDTTLICEVSDGSGTAPHLRRAKTFDEGGRGLLLVAQLTQRWGSRHTEDGKTIWAELTLAEE
ncbi:Phosphoserine phosphatase RsbU [Streptomyces graminofaciens]|uniref:Phosphoserine phosphatase RsbU n=1 Tax=Streptomyces graminofaciens TaxID=68212 RepID=A0ABM7FQ81_9ACTN|nr:SpoIIE family protein phosphatase [Streptomyces graminofaciens]BBC38876.1 Phosphoserine phosphatase RsbU [Streptomyces graminofaciens]